MDNPGKHWKTLWEEYSEAEKKNYDAKTVEELINNVDNGFYGTYYRIWYSIAERATLAKAGSVLFDVLHRKIDYLYRYHCAAALLELMDEKEMQPVDLSGDHPDRDEFLDRIEKKLETMLKGIQKTGEGVPEY